MIAMKWYRFNSGFQIIYNLQTTVLKKQLPV